MNRSLQRCNPGFEFVYLGLQTLFQILQAVVGNLNLNLPVAYDDDAFFAIGLRNSREPVSLRSWMAGVGLDLNKGLHQFSTKLTLPFVVYEGNALSPLHSPNWIPELSLGAMIPILAASGYSDAAGFLGTILAAANQRNTLASPCTPNQPAASSVVPFGPAPGTDFYPNPPTVYLQTSNYCLQPKRCSSRFHSLNGRRSSGNTSST